MPLAPCVNRTEPRGHGAVDAAPQACGNRIESGGGG